MSIRTYGIAIIVGILLLPTLGCRKQVAPAPTAANPAVQSQAPGATASTSTEGGASDRSAGETTNRTATASAAQVTRGMTTPGAPVKRVTFNQDVLPIVTANCQTCHSAAGVSAPEPLAPMAFIAYQQVRPWAKSIERLTGSEVNYVRHAGADAALTPLSTNDAATISTWVRFGAPRGSPTPTPTPKPRLRPIS